MFLLILYCTAITLTVVSGTYIFSQHMLDKECKKFDDAISQQGHITLNTSCVNHSFFEGKKKWEYLCVLTFG
jgi:hypothetical protein